ncbi:MAG: peptidase S41 [Bacteroides sp. SM23_62_1]|nr:MAG: peptidase S41 [Bacteroides sp. SM23_62_1]
MRKIINLVPILLVIHVIAPAQVLSDESLKFSQLLNWVDKYYVDSVNKNELVEKAIVEMLKSLDPHSTYLNKEEVRQMNEPLQGNFEGIGISFNILDDTIFVINPIPGGPSEKVGILAGDRIVQIDGENVAGIGIKNSDVFAKLRGTKGTKVTVAVKRRTVQELMDFTITRDKIPIFSLDASYIIDDKIGYIKLNRFSFTTLDEFQDALSDLQKKGIEDLILDLSNNGGGYLDVAVKLADQFLEDQKLIVYTQGDKHPKRTYLATSRGDFEKGRLVVIIDEGSASASEIVAGAIQDWDRGIIVGRRSFGKGLVQNPMILIDSSMVRLTIARYYTPTGRLIQKPYDKGFDEYSNDLMNRLTNGELISADSIVFPENLKYQTLTTQRTVYGGGGIMPDYFTPFDTSYQSPYFNKLLNQGILNLFVLNYVDDNRGDLHSDYPEFDVFNKQFFVSDKLINQLIKYAEEEGLELNPEGLSKSKEQIRLLMKAYMARDLWNTSEFYQIINTRNNSVVKAVEILQDTEKYQAALQHSFATGQ